MHIKNLPRDSAFVRSLQGVRAYWDESTELIASLVDATNWQTYVLGRVNGRDFKLPLPLQRPGQPAPAAAPLATVSLADFAQKITE